MLTIAIFQAKRSDLDMNHHVNNVKYVRWMLEVTHIQIWLVSNVPGRDIDMTYIKKKSRVTSVSRLVIDALNQIFITLHKNSIAMYLLHVKFEYLQFSFSFNRPSQMRFWSLTNCSLSYQNIGGNVGIQTQFSHFANRTKVVFLKMD